MSAVTGGLPPSTIPPIPAAAVSSLLPMLLPCRAAPNQHLLAADPDSPSTFLLPGVVAAFTVLQGRAPRSPPPLRSYMYFFDPGSLTSPRFRTTR